MKSIRVLILSVAIAFAMFGSAEETKTAGVIPVATALDHVTVLEFGEPVTLAAAGSAAFQVERHENKVFIKPLKAGQSTDLLVWTASRRFAYELEAPGEVKNMSVAIDSAPSTSVSRSPEGAPGQLDEIVDMMFTRMLLDAEPIDASTIKNSRIAIHVERVFRTRNSTYLHYSITNRTKQLLHISAPTIAELKFARPSISLISLQGKQLTDHFVRDLGTAQPEPLAAAHSEIESEALKPGDRVQGVIAIRQPMGSPAVIQLNFATNSAGAIKATTVF